MVSKTFKKNCQSFLDTVIALLFGTIMLLTAFQVVSRYLLFFPAPWVEEFISFLFVWMIFTGSAAAHFQNDHTRVEILSIFLSSRSMRRLNVPIGLLVLVFLCTVVFYGVELVQHTFTMSSQILKISMGVFYLSAPAGSSLMLIATLYGFFDTNDLTGVD